MIDIYSFFFNTMTLSADLILSSVPMMAVGVFIAELIVSFNAAERLSRFSRPVTDFAHLHPDCGLSFMMAFISPRAANAMLVKYEREGEISHRELLIAALMNSFPNVVMHWRYLLPVYVPLLGFIGLAYFLILTVVGFVKTGIVVVAGKFLLESREFRPVRKNPPKEADIRTRVRESLHATVEPLVHILRISIPVLIIVAALINLGVFDYVASGLQGFGKFFPVPAAGFAIIAAQFGSFIAGASVASALLNAGTLSGADVVVTLLVGNILTSVTRGIRFYGSSYAAIFGPKTGAEVQVISIILRNAIMLVALFILVMVWQ